MGLVITNGIESFVKFLPCIMFNVNVIYCFNSVRNSQTKLIAIITYLHVANWIPEKNNYVLVLASAETGII